jgi:hypothetical protein
MVVVMAAGVGVVLVAQRRDAFHESAAHPAIEYATRPVHDRLARLDEQFAAGTVRLSYDPSTGYLPSLLSALDIPPESQMLVFSKTSAQANLIDMGNPRAVYFGDDVAVARVRGSDRLELAAHDPEQGVVFYTLDDKAGDTPRLTRRVAECLMCHLTWDTLAVPGFTIISTFPMSDSPTAYATGVSVDERTPIADRWGGWFVTGRGVPRVHRGNVPVVQTDAELARPAPPPPVLASVNGRVDTAGYLTPYSDIVALMVFEHEAQMTNYLTRLNWEARVAAAAPGSLARVADAANDLVDYMLFVDEAPLPGPIEGSSGFAEKFVARGPVDAQGRSLRQLDLATRLMKYPCSYLIYSQAFDALPATAKDAVYRRLWQVLSGGTTSKSYAFLTPALRLAIIEILRDTKKDLPGYFRAAR